MEVSRRVHCANCGENTSQTGEIVRGVEQNFVCNECGSPGTIRNCYSCGGYRPATKHWSGPFQCVPYGHPYGRDTQCPKCWKWTHRTSPGGNGTIYHSWCKPQSYKRNPWSSSDVGRFNKACARTAKCRNQWTSIANSTLASTGDEGRAIRTASGVVKKRGLTRRRWRRNPMRNRLRRHHGWRHRSSWRHNPWWRNPSEDDDMRLINKTLKNMTPCDKADWGFARRNPQNRWSGFTRDERSLIQLSLIFMRKDHRSDLENESLHLTPLARKNKTEIVAELTQMIEEIRDYR